MYKAINCQDNTPIIILDPQWRSARDTLRALSHQDVLICQVCQRPVLARMGQIKRWHFAHKVLADCPVTHESPALLQARALLYEWLCSKFKSPATVTLEHHVTDDRLPRPVDCWVDLPTGAIAYWVIEHQQVRDRAQHQAALTQAAAHVQWVFLSQTCQIEGSEVELSPTHRDLMVETPYDRLYHKPLTPLKGRSLSFLDPDAKTLQTLRHLYLVHGVGRFAAQVLEHPLEEMLVGQKTGGFVHPGEHEALQDWKQAQAATAEALKNDDLVLARLRHTATYNDSSGTQGPTTPPVCEICGIPTNDWWTKNGQNNTCQCNSCLRQGKFR